MSEDADPDSKTEDPTAAKLQQAKDKGQTATSREVAVLASLLVLTAWLLMGAGDATRRLVQRLTQVLERLDQFALDTPTDAVTLLHDIVLVAAAPLSVLLLALMLAGLVSGAAQTEPRFVAERIRPKASHISLPKGLNRIFGKPGLVEFAKALTKLLVAGLAAVGILASGWPLVAAQVWYAPALLMDTAHSLMVQTLIAVCGTMVVIAVADFAWSKKRFLDQQKMTPKEVKDEAKQSEGDPILKARLRSLAQDRSRNRMMADVPDATLLIANPTHYAIALRYAHGRDAAPVVVAKGTDLICLRMREIAEEAGVPVFEDKPLTRAMYPIAEIGEHIPEQYFVAIAKLVREINRTAPTLGRPRL